MYVAAVSLADETPTSRRSVRSAANKASLNRRRPRKLTGDKNWTGMLQNVLGKGHWEA
jgi:hypothetical protein